MTFKQTKEIRLFLIVFVVLFYSFQLCCSVSLAQREDDSTIKRGESPLGGLERPEDGQQGRPHAFKQVTWTPSLDLSILSELLQPQLDFKPTASPPPSVRTPKPGPNGYKLALNSATWTAGHVKKEGRLSATDSEDGYQADFTGQAKLNFIAQLKVTTLDQSA